MGWLYLSYHLSVVSIYITRVDKCALGILKMIFNNQEL